MAAVSVTDDLRRPVPRLHVRRLLRDAAEEAGLELVTVVTHYLCS